MRDVNCGRKVHFGNTARKCGMKIAVIPFPISLKSDSSSITPGSEMDQLIS